MALDGCKYGQLRERSELSNLTIFLIQDATANFTELVSSTGEGSCLTLLMEGQDYVFQPVSCTEESYFTCEMRVRTVTLQPWLVANWFSVLLVSI